MKYRSEYTEVDTVNMLAYCRRNGLSVDAALKLFVARTPGAELRALKDGEVHEDAAGAAPAERCPDCPHKPKHDDTLAATASLIAGTATGTVNQRAPAASADQGWGMVIDHLNRTRGEAAIGATE